MKLLELSSQKMHFYYYDMIHAKRGRQVNSFDKI